MPDQVIPATGQAQLLPSDTGVKLMQRVEALAMMSESDTGLTRRFATTQHRQANNQVGEWMRAAGMQVHEDAIGNIVGRYEGAQPNAPAIMLGSHLDTVVMAGKYDGMLGVLTALACVEHLSDAGKRLPHAIEVIGFSDEEGVRYQSTFLGSRAVSGDFDMAVLDRLDKDGISMRDALRAFSRRQLNVADAARKPEDIIAYLEVHIEQGPRLELENLSVGAVTAIAGATRMVVTLKGEAGHAGTVPMTGRRDALAAAAECILGIERLSIGPADLVGTVGAIRVEPDASNVIPGFVEFSVDLRATDDERRRQAVEEVVQHLQQVATDRALDIGIEHVHEENSVACDKGLIGHIGRAIAKQGGRVLELSSGAGHDAAAMHSITPVGMIFVRCAGGVSHNPAESVLTEDAAMSAEVLMQTVLNLSNCVSG